MLDQELDCIAGSAADTRPVHAVRPDGLAAFLDTLLPARAAFLRDADFEAKAGELAFLPGPQGIASAVLGLGTEFHPVHLRQPADAPARGRLAAGAG